MADKGKSDDDRAAEVAQYLRNKMENPDPDPVCGCGKTKAMGLPLGHGWRWVCPAAWRNGAP
jgi:hypothetical protein